MKRFLILLLMTLPCIPSLASNGISFGSRPLYGISSPLETAFDDRRTLIVDVGASTSCCLVTVSGINWGVSSPICAGGYETGEYNAYQDYIDYLWLEIHNTSESYKTLEVYIDGVMMASRTIDYGWAYCFIPSMTLPSGNLTMKIVAYTGIVF